MKDFKILGKNGEIISIPETLHPGEVLNLELEARGIKKADFAAQIGVKASHLSALLHAKRHVGAALALKLEFLLDIKAEFWMRLQTAFDLASERQKAAEQEMAMAA